MSQDIITIDEKITIDDIIQVSRYNKKVELSLDSIKRIKKARNYIDEKTYSGTLIYGVNTGVGKLCNTIVDSEQQQDYQKRIILSHACGSGDNYSTEIVRAAMLLLVNSISKGYSGTSLEVVNLFIQMLNKNITSIVPQKGSLGASGDLVPLAHMALPLIGYGQVFYNGKMYDSNQIFKQENIEIVNLKSKDALSIINGTHFMTAVGAILLFDSYKMIKISDFSASLTIEALNGIIDNYNIKTHLLRSYAGQLNASIIINNLLKNSQFITNSNGEKVQDAYSIRCIPQVHGASKDAFNYTKQVIEKEINSVTDNPLIFVDEDMVLSGGNFHGQPLALAYDFLSIALSELCDISERRIERLVNPNFSGLPPFLIKESGINSGLMIAQYVAASLVSENKVLSHPASVDSIPSSANQEDHVSMGSISVRKCLEIKNNLSRILSIELLCASQALDLKEKLKLGDGTLEIYEQIRSVVEFMENDRFFYKDINNIEILINSENFISTIENKIGKIEF